MRQCWRRHEAGGRPAFTQLRTFAALTAAVFIAACSAEEAPSETADGKTAITFATDWRAQAEQGGYYQALATGEYEKRGLDVTILQGGPAVNVPQLLAKKIEVMQKHRDEVEALFPGVGEWNFDKPTYTKSGELVTTDEAELD